MKWICSLIIIHLLITSFQNSFASHSFEIRQITNSNGLSNSSINTIFQDSENILWVGTWDGLNRFDGSEFTIFTPELNNPNSLSNQVVLNITEDRYGYIWINTMHGINRYDKNTNNFKSFFWGRKNKTPLNESEFHITLDTNKIFFCAVKDWGIGYYKEDRFHVLKTTNTIFESIHKIDFSLSGTLLLLFESGKLSEIKLKYHSDGTISIINEKVLLQGVHDFINFTSNEILVLLDNNELWQYSLSNYKKYNTSIKGVDKIIGKSEEGVFLTINFSTCLLNFQIDTISTSWLKQIGSKKISTIFEGNEGIVWVGTDGDGMFKIYPKKKIFRLFSQNEVSALEGSNVRAFCETPDNSFWVGTKGNGLFRLQSEFYLDNKNEVTFNNFNSTNSSLNNSIFSLFYGQDSLLYIGTDDTGVSIYDLKDNKFIYWQNILGNELCEDFKSVYSIFQDKDGTLWMGTYGFGMISCKINRSANRLEITSFKQYLADETLASSISGNIIFSIIPENDTLIWIGTRLGGLNLFNKKTQQFKVFRKDENDSSGLSNNDILCLCKDQENSLWIGTSLGLNHLIRKEGCEKVIIENYTTKNGLPNNTIHGIVSDSNENIWISTNFGLSQFIISKKQFKNFTENDGLQNNEFADGAYYFSNSTGFVFMGGINGFNCFNPSEIGEYDYIPNLLVSEIAFQSHEKPFYNSFVITPDSIAPPLVVLKHNQNFFNIKLAALSYINSEKCQYSYKLTNFDRDWNSIGSRRTISFTNVPSGEYSLWLKWSNGDNIWSKPVHAIDFDIKPIFWKSKTAIILYSILSLLIALLIINYLKKRQLLKQNVLLRQKEKEMHQNRLSFFTNIAHELQTPLTLIVGPSQKLAEIAEVDTVSYKFIKMIQQNTTRLLFLIQQLLDFRKAELGHLDIKTKQFNLVILFKQIAELFSDLAIQNFIDYEIETPEEIVGWFDQDKIEKILFNLLSNAFKYTPANGHINVKLLPENDSSNQVKMIISNTGKGISKENIEYLFDQFFIDKDAEIEASGKFRTGIGLAYTKRLISLLKGTIEVKSIINKLTTFTVTLPGNINTDKTDSGYIEHQIKISKYLKSLLNKTDKDLIETNHKYLMLTAIEKQLKKVLVVEDEVEIHDLLKELFIDKYQIIGARNGVEALKVMETETPDLIITDVMMPEMDGIEFCRKIKTNIETCHIPVIMLTAKDSVIHKIEGIESGANSYIPKPFYPEYLEVRINKLLEERALIKKYFTEDFDKNTFSNLPIQNADKEFIAKVIELIKTNLSNPDLNSSFIEKAIGISSSQFYRKVKQISSMSPSDIIRTIRLKHAAKLLRTTSLNVSEVFFQSGFNNRSYFYREFQKMYKSTPKNYQIKHRR